MTKPNPYKPMRFTCYSLLATIISSTLLLSCKSPGTTTALRDNPLPEDPNNIVTQKAENSVSNPASSTEIIFEGTNNLFELISQNSKFFDEHHDVIIIKGDNNIIRLININLVDIRPGSSDTLIIIGNNQKYVMDTSNKFLIKSNDYTTVTVVTEQRWFNLSAYQQEEVDDDRQVRLGYFDQSVSLKYAHQLFRDSLVTGKPVFYHELAELYLYGLGVEVSPAKAIDLYEFAAAKDYIPSLKKLGDIYQGRFNVDPDHARSLYYYKRCRNLGDSYCEEQISKIVRR